MLKLNFVLFLDLLNLSLKGSVDGTILGEEGFEETPGEDDVFFGVEHLSPG